MSNQNLSLQLSCQENGNTYFLVFIIKRHCLYIITMLCCRPNAQIKIQNLLQILLTFTVQIYIYIVSLFLAERSEIKKRLFLCGRIAQYRGLGSLGYLTCMFQSFYHFFVFDDVLICLWFQYLCIRVEGLILGRDVI